MSEPLHVAPLPCTTCPYRRDTPPGIWHPDEYAKLPLYDDRPILAAFLCHQSTATGKPTICRGWLSVHSESPAVRLALILGTVTPEQVYADVPVKLYASGTEAATAGMAGVEHPDASARTAIDRLITKGIAR